MKISYSKVQTYKQCPKKYELYYITKLKPVQISSALAFGKTVDDCLNSVLEGNHDIEKMQMLFTQKWSLYKNANLIYSKADFDSRFAEEGDAWTSLLMKGKIIIKSYIEQVIPLLSEVISVQKHINIKNAEGDELTGVIDFIAKFKGDDTVYIIDNKTTSVAYKDDSVATSEQLATYCEHEGVRHAAYIVINKAIPKKELKAKISIIKGRLHEETIEHTFLDYQQTLDYIKAEKFEHNWKSRCYFYGKPCEYYQYCRNGSTQGLKKE